ncbi:MAG: DUF488 domain-containing protein [bacterium]|nr:DUF488 domain-containing protein [bacterium]
MPRTSNPRLQVKRVYDAPASSDDRRVLVDRVWPRGLSKEAAKLDAWIKDVAPSAELRKWFGHEPSRWVSFKHRYFHELDGQQEALEELLKACSGRTVTLLFAAKDSAHNNAVALQKYLGARIESQG